MNERSFRVQEDKFQYRIEVKIVGRQKKNKKLQHIRGYATAASAHEDIPRLEMYLKSGHNISTFRRYVPNEMDELLAPPAKRSCSRQQKDARKPTTTKVMNGCIFIRLRRQLSWKYHKYKKGQTEEMAPLLSKEEWLQKHKQEMLSVPNFGDLEQEFRCQTALTYINQRLRVVRSRKLKNVALMDGLRTCVYRGFCFSKIREALVEEKNGIIDLTKDGPKFTVETTTSAQLNRVIIQCLTVLSMLQQLDQRNDTEATILDGFLSQINLKSTVASERQLMFKEHEILKKQFRAENNMNILSERVKSLAGSAVSAKKIREWYHEYLEYESFEEDLRGGWKRDMFLEEYGYSLRFQIYMKNERKLTVDVATKELESIIHKDPPKTEQGKRAFDNLRPFARRTVYRWMIKLGCKYEKATVSYYTDSHEAEETKKDMKER